MVKVLGITLTTLALSYYYNREGGRYYKRYQDATEEKEILRYRTKTEEYDTRRNQAIIALLLNHAVNIVDIYYFSNSVKKSTKKRRSGLSIVVVPSHTTVDTIDFFIAYKFTFSRSHVKL